MSANHADNHATPAKTDEKNEEKKNSFGTTVKEWWQYPVVRMAIGAMVIAFLLVAGLKTMTANTTTVVASTDFNKRIALIESKVNASVNSAPAQVAVLPSADEPPIAGNHSQCDDGWQFNGSICTREGRPTKSQVAQSFVPATCKPGDTRVIDRKVVEGGREIIRKVTQTCGVKS